MVQDNTTGNLHNANGRMRKIFLLFNPKINIEVGHPNLMAQYFQTHAN